MKKGLVLEGGSMRALFSSGVFDVFLKNDITFDGTIGVSAGSGFGCNFKSKQLGRAIRYSKRFAKDKRYAGWGSWIKTGDLYNADFIYNQVPNKYDIFDSKAFRENPMEFYVTCTDIETGLPVYHRLDNGDATDIEWMRASASLPLVARIVELDGYKLLDGGIVDSVPLRHLESLGYERNVVVLTQPKGYVKKKNSMLPLLRLTHRKYPKLLKAIEARHEMYNETYEYIEQKEKNGELFVIRPEAPLNVSGVIRDENELERVYQHGIAEAEKHLEALKHFLAV